jgi:hypothetical protein
MRSANIVSGGLGSLIFRQQKPRLALLYFVIAVTLTGYRGWGSRKQKEEFPIRYKDLALGFLNTFALIELLWTQTFYNLMSDVPLPP